MQQELNSQLTHLEEDLIFSIDSDSLNKYDDVYDEYDDFVDNIKATETLFTTKEEQESKPLFDFKSNKNLYNNNSNNNIVGKFNDLIFNGDDELLKNTISENNESQEQNFTDLPDLLNDNFPNEFFSKDLIHSKCIDIPIIGNNNNQSKDTDFESQYSSVQTLSSNSLNSGYYSDAVSSSRNSLDSECCLDATSSLSSSSSFLSSSPPKGISSLSAPQICLPIFAEEELAKALTIFNENNSDCVAPNLLEITTEDINNSILSTLIQQDGSSAFNNSTDNHYPLSLDLDSSSLNNSPAASPPSFTNERSGSILSCSSVNSPVSFPLEIISSNSSEGSIANSEQRRVSKSSRPVQCDICNAILSRPDALKLHKESKHEGVKFKCEECNVQLASAAIRRRHMATYHGLDALSKFVCFGLILDEATQKMKEVGCFKCFGRADQLKSHWKTGKARSVCGVDGEFKNRTFRRVRELISNPDYAKRINEAKKKKKKY